MTIAEAVREANRTEDAKRILVILEKCRIRGMNYAQTQELMHRCDPTIDAARYEELCALADGVGVHQ